MVAADATEEDGMAPREPIYLERRDGVAELVLNRPDKRNAITRGMWARLPALLDEAASDGGTTVLIVRGATAAAFSAGADIAEFESVHASEDSIRAYDDVIERAFDALARFDRPTIAEISGICFGGGCALALCCDVRYADPTARFCIPPARLGIVYSLKDTKRLLDLVGPAKTKEMLMGARVVDAGEALAIGLVTRLFPADGLAAATRAYAADLAGLSQVTIRATKRIVEEILEGASEETPLARRLRLEAYGRADYAEGRAAFLEKRPARFTER